jgi:endonuclease/exonuclease/phosphatase family metal-dependent hydrolase
MSFNIRYDTELDGKNSWDNRKDSLVQFLINEKPSIIGVQEALLNQIEFIVNGMPNYKYIGVGRDDGATKGEYSAVLYNSSEFKVDKNSTFWLSENPDTVSVGWDAALPRVCTYGLFLHTKTSNKLWVFNTHFDHMGSVARETSAKLIVKKISEINTNDYAAVLMGDLNATPDETPIQVITSELNDGLKISVESITDSIGTFNGFSETIEPRRIDYIFSNMMNVLSYNHIYKRINGGGFLSDHYPVTATIKLD